MIRHSTVESLEPRRLFSTISLGADGVLDIALNAGDDRARILQHPGTSRIDVLVRREAFRQYDGVTLIRIDGRTGRDVMYLGATVTVPCVMIGGLGRDVLVGGVANDTFDGGPGFDYVNAGGGDDTIVGGLNRDVLDGGAGNDTIDGGAGPDEILGGAGDDRITGGTGVDNIDGGDGNDIITGGAGRDVLRGGVGADTFSALDKDREIRDLATDDLRTGA